MIIGGIELRLWAQFSQTQASNVTLTNPIQATSSHAETTIGAGGMPNELGEISIRGPGESMEHFTGVEHQHFVQLGGPATVAGTLVFSNPTVQEWVWDLLGWSDKKGPDGSDLAY